jgi:hypothetical protein
LLIGTHSANDERGWGTNTTRVAYGRTTTKSLADEQSGRTGSTRLADRGATAKTVASIQGKSTSTLGMANSCASTETSSSEQGEGTSTTATTAKRSFTGQVQATTGLCCAHYCDVCSSLQTTTGVRSATQQPRTCDNV